MFDSRGVSYCECLLMDNYCRAHGINPDNHGLGPTQIADILAAEKRRLHLVPVSELLSAQPA